MRLQKKYILVVNPISGDVDKTEIIQAAYEYAGNLGIAIIIYETTGKHDEAALKILFDEVRPERILIVGGDGTIKLVAEAMEYNDVIIGILPAGSANGLAVDLNLPNTLDENLAIAFLSDYMEIDMVSINGIKSLHLSDIGLNAELIKNYENSTIRGKLGYAIQTITTLSDQGVPFTATITVNKQKTVTEATMIVIANSKKYGTGVTINPEGVLNDGKFEIVILKNLDFSLFSKIVTGNMPLDSDDIEIISTDKATVSTDMLVHFQVDGEYCGQVKALDIHILHKQMKVAVPIP